jgi:hypothetical protein
MSEAPRLDRVAFTTSRLAEFVGEKELTAQVGASNRFLRRADEFADFNPHLTLSVVWDGEKAAGSTATDPGWKKWLPSDFTSAHWYISESFERYIAAHVARDLDLGRSGRTVRDFIGELRGLTGSRRRAAVLAETGTAGVTLAEFFGRGRDAILRLLESCKLNTAPVKPELLGVIGEQHMLANCVARGGERDSFHYRKKLGTTLADLPYVVEAAFAWCDDEDENRRWQLITGVNFSVSIDSDGPGPFDSLSSVLQDHHVAYDDPVVLLVHYACPRVEFADRGKGKLVVPLDIRADIRAAVKSVTKAWGKQREAEWRSASAASRRRERLLREQNRPKRNPPAEPTGVLAERIHQAAAEAAVPVAALIVLSEKHDPYMQWKHRRAAEWFAEWFVQLVPAGATKHLRGFFYLLVSRGDITGPNGKPFVNNHNCWCALQAAAKAARWLGLVPFDRIVDERNALPVIYVPALEPLTITLEPGEYCSLPNSFAELLPRQKLDGAVGRQKFRIAFYGEKSSLAIVLDPIAREIGAELILVTGESSHTRIVEMAERAHRDGRPLVIFYYADFDPGGAQMSISVSRSLQGLIHLQYPTLRVELHRVALTVEQCNELDLPSSPLKPEEKRADKWREAYGREQTELDALIELRPDKLAEWTRAAVEPYWDATLDDRVQKVVDEWQERADAALHEHPEYEAGCERIKELFEKARDAVEALEDEQARLTDLLRENEIAPPEIPEAELQGERKTPLFDSEMGFAAASQRLISFKKLDDEEDDEDDE